MTETTDHNKAGRALSWLWKLVVLIAALALLLTVGRQAAGYLPAFAAWVDGLGFWGPLVFIAGYALATVGFVPGSILTMAGGVLFGLARGSLFVLIGASIGAIGAFLIARYVARGAIERRLEGNPRFASIDEAVGREGLKIVFLLRLSPVFPFNLLNYGLGLTKVRLRDYALACLGMAPGTFLYVYYGKALGSLAALASGTEVERGTGDWALLGLGLLATLIVTAFVTRIARKALQEEVSDA